MSTIAPAPSRSLERWGALGGIAYVILFLGGVILAYSGQPDGDAPPAKVISYYADSGHRDKIFIGWVLVMLGVFSLLWFLAALRQFLRRVDADGFLTNLATIGGTVYAAMTLAAISLDTAIRTMSDDTFRHQVFPALIHAAGDSGYVIHSAGGIGIGALIIATSAAAARAGVLPRWAGTVGIIVGVLALGSILFLPQFLIALWLIFAGWLLYRATAAVPPAAPAVPPVP